MTTRHRETARPALIWPRNSLVLTCRGTLPSCANVFVCTLGNRMMRCRVRCARRLFEVGCTLVWAATPAALGGCSGDASLGADELSLNDASKAGGPGTDVASSGGIDSVATDRTNADRSSGGSTGTTEGGSDATGGAPTTGGTSAPAEPTDSRGALAGAGGAAGAGPRTSTGGQRQSDGAGAGGADVEAAGWSGASSDPGGVGAATAGAAGETCTLVECARANQCVEYCGSEDITFDCCPCEDAGMVDRNTCP
jgi:hypothetical protein